MKDNSIIETLVFEPENIWFTSDMGKNLSRLKNLCPRQYDVGVDNNDFRPVSFKEVKSKNDIQVNALSNHI